MTVGCLLTKLRLGLSNNVLTTLFSFSGKRIVDQVIESVQQSLIKHFVPQYLGCEHISHEKIIKHHTRPLAKYLLTGGKDVAVLILDGPISIVKRVHVIYCSADCSICINHVHS